MTRGIYILGNDRVLEATIALLESIRYYDKDVPVVLLPFNDEYQKMATVLGDRFGVRVFPDMDFYRKMVSEMAAIFPPKFFPVSISLNRMRKFAAWFGDLDEFLYIDTDIVVFDRIIKVLEEFGDRDFIWCDYQYKSGLKNNYTEVVREKGVFSEAELQDVFNSGFWGSKKSILTEEKMYDLWRECAQHREYFDFEQGTDDQSILNYMVHKFVSNRLNLTTIPEYSAGNWGGSSQFRREGNVLYDGDKKLLFLHWAGLNLKPGTPYWDLWKFYRYLHDPEPDFPEPEDDRPTLLQKVVNKIKRLMRF